MEKENIKSYAGFTIGPVIKVIRHSRKTRELWFGSYFFSWYMEMIISNLSETDDIEFLKPFIPKNGISLNTRAGIYPDRFVLCSVMPTEKLFEEISCANKMVFNEIIRIIDDLRQKEGARYLSNNSKVCIEKIMHEFLHTDFVVLSSEEIEQESVIACVESRLDDIESARLNYLGHSENTCGSCMELPAIFELNELESGELKILHLCPLCFLKYKAHHSNDLKQKLGISSTFRYPSVAEIAAKELFYDCEELKVYIKDKDEIDLNDSGFLNIVNGKLRPFHKYFAIVQADGDNLGALAKTVENPTELSKRLYSFSIKAYELITKEFKGEAIYIGGDDILAFMPIAFPSSDSIGTVFDFAYKLSELYKQNVAFGVNNNGTQQFGISVGLSIGYYKWPLRALLDESRTQLFEKAKCVEGKNSISVSFRKHSGQTSNLSFSFNSGVFAKIREMFADLLSGRIKVSDSARSC